MTESFAPDEGLIQRLPLPLAQLYRRAHNTKGLECHSAAFYLAEAAVKLLGAGCTVEYARLGKVDAKLEECLQNLARPSLGHWWELIRRITPVLAAENVQGFAAVNELLFGRNRDDLPRTAGLDAALIEALTDKRSGKATVKVADLFTNLVRYRNKTIGHGALGQRSGDFYTRMGQTLAAGLGELLGRLDVLAGRRLVFVSGVSLDQGRFVIERIDLSGENPRRLEPLAVPREQIAVLPDGGRVYLAPAGGGPEILSLHPLVVFDSDAGQCAFLNSRKGSASTEYLCYTTDKTFAQPDLGSEQRALLARALGMKAVSEEEAAKWAEGHEEAASDEPAAAAPHMLGDYELLGEIGRGGMGIVYRAVQPQVRRPVAVKRLYMPGERSATNRFHREIEALGSVDHPNLVKIYGSGCDHDQWYYVMQLIPGVPLSEVSKKLVGSGSSAATVDARSWQAALSTVCDEARDHETSTLPPSPPAKATPSVPPSAESPPPEPGSIGYIRRVVQIVVQVADAAAALHAKGILHRDIKPANIMLDASGAHATLMDLGLAKFLDRPEDQLTRTRGFVGTVRYASPEQVLALGELKARSDVYSLGATLWELLALHPIHGADTLTEPQLMRKIVYKSVAGVRRFNANVPPDLDTIIQRALERDPEDRYPSATDFANDLRRWLDGKPISPPAGSVWRRSTRWLKRHPVSSGTAALFVLALMASLIFARNHWTKSDDANSLDAGHNGVGDSGSLVPGDSVEGKVKGGDFGSAVSAPPLPKLTVLAIGVEYAGAALQFAARDAEEFAMTIETVSKPLYRQIDVRLLNTPEKTRKNDILDGLHWLGQSMEEGDFGIFYFAGYGFTDKLGAPYFLPIDGNQEQLAGSAIDGELLMQTLTRIAGQTGASGNLIVMLDACFAGSLRDIGIHEKADNLKGASSKGKGLVIMFASSGSEMAREDTKNKHGTFTLALLEGLRGVRTKYMAVTRTGSDGKPFVQETAVQESVPLPLKNGVLYFTGLMRYVLHRVPELTNNLQHPVTAIPAGEDFPISKFALPQALLKMAEPAR